MNSNWIYGTLVGLALIVCIPSAGLARVAEAVPDSSVTTPVEDQLLEEASVNAKRKPLSKLGGVENGYSLSREEIFKAACCNLGESFTTNPSVDVSYTDAATGARQIKLLGLAGIYVQMLTENVPAFRGAAQPFGLGYVPGTWMQSIQVSKGAASVKNGFESITGQINVEYKKPQADPSLEANIYGDSKSRLEANVDANIRLSDKVSTSVLAHYEDQFGHHDENDDGFYDKPKVRQYHFQHRWARVGDEWIFQAAVNALGERRRSGQTGHAAHSGTSLYEIGIDTYRYDGFVKNAFILDPAHGTNIALILSGSYHDEDATYGNRFYNVRQKEGYAQLFFETDFSSAHSLSLGFNVNHDYYDQHYLFGADEASDVEKETTSGAYAQYTYTLGENLTAMAGLRIDYSSVYGHFATPRFHIKYAPSSNVSIRLSAGKGYRTVHARAEFNYLLASGRSFELEKLNQEEAWNYGASINFKIPLCGHILDLSAEYYYTHFLEQAVVDMDADVGAFYICNLRGRSYSHTFQVEATYPIFRGMSLTAAYRYNNVRQYTAGAMREKPLTGKFKALVTATYKTPLELWQFDATLSLFGTGRLPLHYADDGETLLLNEKYPTYAQLNAQVTRWFRHWSIYVGGENLTNYKQKNPILSASDPWSELFDATQVWGPVHGAMVYGGIRVNF